MVRRLIARNMPRREALELAGFLAEACVPAPLSVSAFEEEDGESWMVEALVEPADVADVLAAVAAAEFDAGALRVEALPDVDWVAESQKALKPVRAGRFFIHGAHDADKVPPGGVIPLLIEAGQAFGSGHHGTTRGCLLALDWLLRRSVLKPGAPGLRVLDVGTGSGVLAIGAARALKCPVVASDIDAVAVRVAAENARANRAHGLVRFITAAGTRHALIRRDRPYQLVFANILAGPLKRLAPELAEVAAAGGWLILSGLLHAQAAGVLAACRGQGMRLARRWRLDEWSTLLLRKG